MDQKLEIILRAAASVQAAVLKFGTEEDEGHKSVQAKIALDMNNTIHCVIADDVHPGKKLGKKIQLVQKYRDDYFFIAGCVSEEAKDAPGIFSIDVNRAFWFVRKRRGSVTWLREKYTYEGEPGRMQTAC